MTEQTPPGEGDSQLVRGRLQELAGRLREAHHLGPEARGELAELVDELAGALDPGVPPALAAHLVETSEHLAHALGNVREEGPLAAARHRLASSRGYDQLRGLPANDRKGRRARRGSRHSQVLSATGRQWPEVSLRVPIDQG